MAKGKAATETTEATEEKKSHKVILPNGVERITYIRDEYYGKGTKRGDIMRAINTMYDEAGQEDGKIPYQIVFSATKPKEDPRVEMERRKAEAAEARAKKAAEEAEAKAKAKAEDAKAA